jgi:hypothetical protein
MMVWLTSTHEWRRGTRLIRRLSVSLALALTVSVSGGWAAHAASADPAVINAAEVAPLAPLPSATVPSIGSDGGSDGSGGSDGGGGGSNGGSCSDGGGCDHDDVSVSGSSSGSGSGGSGGGTAATGSHRSSPAGSDRDDSPSASSGCTRSARTSKAWPRVTATS